MEKRAFKRHIIRLAGKCSVPEVANYPVEITDFCPSGMLLSFEQPDNSGNPLPRQGDIVDVTCAVPTANGEKNLLFRGRVVHASAASAGIAYIRPDFQALHILHGFAKDYPISPDPHESYPATVPAGAPRSASKAAQVLMPACKEIAWGYIDSIAKEFLERVDTRLFDVVGTVSSVSEKNACYDAIHIFQEAR